MQMVRKSDVWSTSHRFIHAWEFSAIESWLFKLRFWHHLPKFFVLPFDLSLSLYHFSLLSVLQSFGDPTPISFLPTFVANSFLI